jgi:hypothetical protein
MATFKAADALAEVTPFQPELDPSARDPRRTLDETIGPASETWRLAEASFRESAIRRQQLERSTGDAFNFAVPAMYACGMVVLASLDARLNVFAVAAYLRDSPIAALSAGILIALLVLGVGHFGGRAIRKLPHRAQRWFQLAILAVSVAWLLWCFVHLADLRVEYIQAVAEVSEDDADSSTAYAGLQPGSAATASSHGWFLWVSLNSLTLFIGILASLSRHRCPELEAATRAAAHYKMDYESVRDRYNNAIAQLVDWEREARGSAAVRRRMERKP